MRTVYPACAQYQVAGAAFAHGLLARQLAAAIGVERTRCIVFRVWTALAAVEDIVSRVVDDGSTEPLGFLRHDSWRFAIDAHRQRQLALGLVDGRIGSRIDDQVRLGCAYHASNLIEVGQVHLRAVQRDHFTHIL
ncbi:hypothetical protein D3C81_1361960 [compost metagenome]